MGGRGEAVSILRSLYRELRPSVKLPQQHVYETQVWKYIVGLCRNCKNQPPAKVGEAQKNLEHTGRSYVLYLQSRQQYHRICDEYKGVGERSVEDTARLVGFKMPHEPKDPPKQKRSSSSSAKSNSPQNTFESTDKSVPQDYGSTSTQQKLTSS